MAWYFLKRGIEKLKTVDRIYLKIIIEKKKETKQGIVSSLKFSALKRKTCFHRFQTLSSISLATVQVFFSLIYNPTVYC